MFAGTKCADSAEGVCASTANGLKFGDFKRPVDASSARPSPAKVIKASAVKQTGKVDRTPSLADLLKSIPQQSAIPIVPRDNLDWVGFYVHGTRPNCLR